MSMASGYPPNEVEGSEAIESAARRPNDLALPDAGQARAPSPSLSRPPTSAEIDAVIAAAMANAPPAPTTLDPYFDDRRSTTPLMTNMLPAAVGSDGRVNLFVGNLPYRVRWQDLKDLFRKAGTVLRADVSLGTDNRSRGYGTVLMGSREDAARAIDRFNGFSWQTRTLEVRPDRLPPEYEPQQQTHLPPARGPPIPFLGNGGNNNYLHGAGPHPGWRPPIQFNQNHGHPMGGNMSIPGMQFPPHHPPPHMNGPIHPRSHSPAPQFGNNGLPLPLSHQHTGTMGQLHGHMGMGASPLAGSLSAGADIIARAGSSASTSGPNGISPHSLQHGLPRVPSPALVPGYGSRPPSSQGHRSVSPNGSQPPLPPHGAPFARASFSGSHSGPGDMPFPQRHSIDHGHVPHLEGLGHRGTGLGPPDNLHDRVVFVQNLPKAMQWQELKDLFRPAGSIMLADVPIGHDGRARGFGTALFASVHDAARAVELFNGYELGTKRIRVYLERDSQHHENRRPSHSQTDSSALGFSDSNEHLSDREAKTEDTPATSPSVQPTPTPRLASRVPWQLNLGNQTPIRGSANGTDVTPRFRSFNTNNGQDSTPHFRQHHHPGPIALPPWPNVDYTNPLSPLQTRGLPPMTPSMPSFIFHPFPETPPVPHHYMGGPFSPGLPITSPTGFAYNPFLNAAPGAPVHRQQMGGSAQLGTPTTQSFPTNTVRGPVGLPAAPGAPIAEEGQDYFPQTGFPQPSSGTHATPPPMPARTISQSVLNARDRLAPSGPDGVAELGTMTTSMSLGTLATGQATPPSPTTAKPKRSVSGSNLARLGAVGSRVNGNGDAPLVGSRPPSPGPGSNGRLSLDEQRPFLTVDGNGAGERRASLGNL